MKKWITTLIVVLTAFNVHAQLRVVATIPNMGMLAREIGGETVTVSVLSPPDRDAHHLEARPGMMAALRRADIVVAVGADLEIGWLPAAIRGANNRRVQPGRPGYFEAAQQVELLQDDKPADRALGDVHPTGNPHLYLDPERMVQVGHALAERFGALDRENADMYRKNAVRFAERIAERIPAWRAAAEGAPGVIAYHSDQEYLLRFLSVPALGYIEPLPGIPPTASHLRELVRTFSNRQGIIWTVDFQPAQAGQFLARELGWPAFQRPIQVALNGDADAYFAMIDGWIETLRSTE